MEKLFIIRKLFGFSFKMYQKKICVKKWFTWKNFLYWKIAYIEKKILHWKLLILKTTCIGKLLGFKNWLYWKTTYIKKSLQTSKKRKSQLIRYKKFPHICPLFVY
jgi:hypothetical protein